MVRKNKKIDQERVKKLWKCSKYKYFRFIFDLSKKPENIFATREFFSGAEAVSWKKKSWNKNSPIKLLQYQIERLRFKT